MLAEDVKLGTEVGRISLGEVRAAGATGKPGRVSERLAGFYEGCLQAVYTACVNSQETAHTDQSDCCLQSFTHTLTLQMPGTIKQVC